MLFLPRSQHLKTTLITKIYTAPLFEYSFAFRVIVFDGFCLHLV